MKKRSRRIKEPAAKLSSRTVDKLANVRVL